MKKINFSSPLNPTGYGIASLNILKALAKQYKISYFPIGAPSVNSQEEFNLINELLENRMTLDPKAPHIKIWHQFDLADHIGKGRYYAYPFFELDTFNDHEKIHLSVPDDIFCSSNWAKQVLINSQVTSPIHVVPLGVDLDIFDYAKYPKHNNSIYTFLTIGKWEVRKGHDLLPDIFKKAFPSETDVRLTILAAENTNSYSNKSELENWKKLYSGDSRISVVPGLPSHQSVAQLIANSDCGLYISRAEGWNLELLETMAMNKPAIATNYSAHTEFCNSQNCYLVEIDSIESANDGKAFRGQGNWAKIGQTQIDQTIEHMRYVYKNRVSTNPNGLNTAKILTWDNSANAMSRCIE
jgi:glycosyltransferase involved in cell wall biosynthesis